MPSLKQITGPGVGSPSIKTVKVVTAVLVDVLYKVSKLLPCGKITLLKLYVRYFNSSETGGVRIITKLLYKVMSIPPKRKPPIPLYNDCIVCVHDPYLTVYKLSN